jgi:hypothetical protein
MQHIKLIMGWYQNLRECIHKGWEALEDCRLVSRLCALLKAYTGIRAWETIGDLLPE